MNSAIKHRIKCSFNKAANSYNNFAEIQSRAGIQLIQKLEDLKLQPQQIVDIGAGTGTLTRLIANLYPRSTMIHIDFSDQMTNYSSKQNNPENFVHILSDFDHLGLASENTDLIFSNFTLQWSLNLERTLADWYRVLKLKGYIIFNILGPKTLKEIKHVWQLLDSDIHTNNFISQEQLKSILCFLKFNIIEMDSYLSSLYFRNPLEALLNLKLCGANYVMHKNSKGLLGKSHFLKMLKLYENLRQSNGFIPMTYEIISMVVRK